MRVTASPAATTATATTRKVWPFTASPSEQARRAHREGEQQHPERHRDAPGRPVEGRGQALRDAEDERGHERSPDRSHAAEDGDREDAADVLAVHRWLDGADHDQEGARERRGADGEPER